MKRKDAGKKPGQTACATVISAHGRHVIARHDDGSLWQVFSRGKKQETAVGDRVMLEPSASEQAWVAGIEPRRNLLYRSDEQRTKLFAANLDLVVLVLAPSPPLSPELVLRTWVACRAADIPLLLVINKTDLLNSNERLDLQVLHLLPVDQADAPQTLNISLLDKPQEALTALTGQLQGKVSLVLGQSGMGKSTLVNLMVPDARAQTGEISEALNSGRHTTTHTRMHMLPGGGALVDSPGFQAFGLSHLKADTLDQVFEWMLRERANCRFYNCKHVNEPGCGVIAAENAGRLDPAWRAFYLSLHEETRQARKRDLLG